MSRLNRDFAIDAISRHAEGPRIDRKERGPAGFPGGAVSHAKTGHVQKRGWPRNSRPIVRAKEPEATRPGSHLHAWRTDPADAARLSLHGVLPQRLRDESISREQRLHCALSELPARHHVRTRVSRAAKYGVARRFGIQGRRGGREVFADSGECRSAADRIVGRLL